MRPLRFALGLLLPVACTRPDAALSGEMLEDARASQVWVLGHAARADVRDGAFRLEPLPSDTLELRFVDGEQVRARMEVRDLRAGSRLHLRGIWIEQGVAFPTALEGEPAAPVSINGLRLAPDAALPDEVDARGALLARSDAADALLVRPDEGRLPDLRVVVTTATQVRTPDGDPAEPEALDFGDRLRVRGPVESGYVIATEIQVGREEASEGRGAEDAGTADVPSRSGDAAEPGAREAVDGGRRDDGGDAEVAPARERGKGKGPPADRGRGRGKGKGKGKDRKGDGAAR